VSEAITDAARWASGTFNTVKDKIQGKEPEKGEVQKRVDAAGTAAKDVADKALQKGAAAKDAAAAKVSAAASDADKKVAQAKAKASSEKETLATKAAHATESVKAAVAPVKEKVAAAAHTLITSVEKSEEKVSGVARAQADQFSEEVEYLVSKAEHILAGKPFAELLEDAEKAVSTPEKVVAEAESGNVYSAPLPLGFEPPPGFARPKPPPKSKAEAGTKAPADGKSVETAPAPPPLPLLAPAIATLGASEPVITQLAGTIDTLASYLSTVPTASDKARSVLSTAQVDLEALAGRVEAVRKEETERLEHELEKQAQEYNSRVIKAEMEAQDRMDTQEETFRKVLDEERKALIQAYREKLEKELATQSEIIDQRYFYLLLTRIRALTMMCAQPQGGSDRSGHRAPAPLDPRDQGPGRSRARRPSCPS
jgi:MICOS complex subunit MIC60